MVDSQDELGKTLGLDLHSVELSFHAEDLHHHVEELWSPNVVQKPNIL